MKKLSKEKRDQLVLVAIGTAMVIGMLYFLVVGAQKESIRKNKANIETLQKKTHDAHMLVRSQTDIDNELGKATTDLSKREEMLAPTRDTYSWMWVKTLIPFAASRDGVVMQTCSTATYGETQVLPDFDYKAARFQVKGEGFYHDIGKFLADFENKFPYCRVENLDLGVANDGEKIGVSFDVVVLLKPTTDAK